MEVRSPASDAEVAGLAAECARLYRRASDDVVVIRAPYRICPLGAHIDHQLGPVSAIGVAHGIHLAFVASQNVRIASRGYSEAVSFALDDPLHRAYDWADYARGALRALRAVYPVAQGAAVLIDGQLSEAGISSSAAVGLGYLLALATVNDIELSATDLIELDRQIENDFLGLKNGVLDQAAITLARAGQLTVVDCKAGEYQHITQAQPFEFLAVYSGIREALVNSNKFNNRVEECLQAGALLHAMETGEDLPGLPLGQVGEAVWQRHGERLPEHLQRRTAHFFGESARVLIGADAWANSDFTTFGKLMLASCESSINNYETGSREMIRLFEILADSPDVLGARFSGAGFRGCAVALIQPGARDDIAAHVANQYHREFPNLGKQMWAIHSEAADGLRLL